MNIDQRLDRITYYVLYIPFNILALILAIPTVLIYLLNIYFTNYNEFSVLFSGYNIVLVYYIFYTYIFECLIKLIN
jgi:hypothetical protein